MYHPFAVTLWVVAAAALALSTRNPIYLALLLGCVWLTYRAARQYNPRANWGSILRLGIWVWAITIPFNALSAHVGRYILFTLPAGWPLIGGIVTVEGVVFGFLNGLSLVLLLSTFAAFNTAVDQYQLLRLVPSAFHHVGMIASIAITFIPVMSTTFEEIRQAQMLRGHRFRGIRDLLPLLAPLLASGLERSIQLAEAMEARGYGGNVRPLAPRTNLLLQLAMLAGLLGLVAGLFLRVYTTAGPLLGTALAAASLSLLTLTLWLQGRRLRRTYYRVWHWDQASTIVAAAAALSLLAGVTASVWSGGGLAYYPYPPNTLLPPFEPLLAAAVLLLALPAALWSPKTMREVASHGG
ncbi:MAG: energy-coupling factor transporter transmembrane component T [Anaerolineae bacterium]